MKSKFTLRKEIKIAMALVMLLFVVAFSERKLGSVVVNDVLIKIENIEENHFLDDHDIVRLMKLEHDNLIGAELDRLNLKEIEDRIKSDRFVKDADLYSDVKGNLVVRTTLRRPVARLIRTDGPDAYIAEDGTLMPVSGKFTARVMLISGSLVHQLAMHENINATEQGKQVMDLIMRINRDAFWKAQIAQLDISRKGKINILPQVGGQVIEFGRPENIETKLMKLKVFYKEILPEMGWNRYKRVNLEFEGQLIAE